MLQHKFDQFVIRKHVLTQSQIFISSLAFAQQVTRFEFHLAEQIAQLSFRQRLNVIIDFLERDATLTEQLVDFSTLRSSWFFVNNDLICHDKWIPRN